MAKQQLWDLVEQHSDDRTVPLVEQHLDDRTVPPVEQHSDDRAVPLVLQEVVLAELAAADGRGSARVRFVTSLLRDVPDLR